MLEPKELGRVDLNFEEFDCALERNKLSGKGRGAKGTEPIVRERFPGPQLPAGSRALKPKLAIMCGRDRAASPDRRDT
jgi:hypothetical protein